MGGFSFDPSTARPVAQFDPSTARPVAPPAPPQRRAPPPGYNDFSGMLTNAERGLTFGLNDEMSGALDAAVTGLGGLSDFMFNPSSQNFDAISGRVAQAYDRGTSLTRAYEAQYEHDHPHRAALAQGVGASVPIVATLGAATPDVIASQAAHAAPGVGGLLARTAVGRGLPALAAQSVRGATVGAAYGGVSGFGNADGQGLLGRTQAATQGAEGGAAIGALLPAAVPLAMAPLRALEPVVDAAGRFADSLPKLAPLANSGTGAFGGQLFSGGLPRLNSMPLPPLRLNGVVGNTVDRLAQRARMTSGDLDQTLSSFRDNPQGQVLADAFGDPATKTVRSITQFPGQTGQLAVDTAHDRFQTAPDRIISAFNQRLGVAETPEQALNSLNQQYDQVSAENYQPLFDQPSTPAQRDLFAQKVEPLLGDPVMQDAIRRGDDIFYRDQRLGLVTGNPEDNLPRYLHYIKMGLDDTIQKAPEGRSGLGATQLRGVMQLRDRFLNALDPGDGSPAIIPGYADARARWGGLAEAEQALSDGRTLINQTSGSIAQRMNAMTPFARYHARVGFADALANRLGLRASVNGNRNVAEALGSPEMQRRVAAMFDTPEQAAEFLDTLNQQNTLMRNAASWNGGSSTAANLAHGDDNLSAALMEAGSHAARGDPVRGAFGLAARAKNLATLGLQERANNQVGAALLTRVDNSDSAGFARAVVRELRRREIMRANNSALGVGAAAAAGARSAQNGNDNGG